MINKIQDKIQHLGLFLLFLLPIGNTGAWAQTDYSGTYYIAMPGSKGTYAAGTPAKNYYLCPTEGWAFYVATNNVQEDDNGQPFLTTYKCRNGVNDFKGKWTIQKSGEYYRILHNKDGKYLTFNGQLSGAGENRVRVHLESSFTGDNNLFTITKDASDHYFIHPKNDASGWYLNVTDGNKDSYGGAAGKDDGPTGYENVGGILGRWNEQNNTSQFCLEDVILPPGFSYNQGDNTISITGSEGETLYYTKDGSKPDPENVGGDYPTKIYSTTIALEDTKAVTTIEVIAKKVIDGEVLPTYSRVATAMIYNHPDITFSEDTYTYDGTALQPTVTVGIGGTIADPSAYTCDYTNNTDVGTATVTIIDNDPSDNIFFNNASTTFTISPRSIGDGTKPADGFEISIEGTPDVTVSVNDGSRDLVLDTDYTWEPDGDNPDVIIITGMGNYGGEARVINAKVTFSSPEDTAPYLAAYNSVIDATPPSGMTAYVVRKVNATVGTVSVTPVNYIPKDVPVILEASTELSGFVASPIGGETTPISASILSSNQLRVAPAGGVEVKSKEAYMFYLGEFVLTQAGTIGEGNIFLYNPNYAAPGALSSRRYLQIVKEDDETGMEELRWTKDNEVYDLSGRRLNLQSSSSKGQLPKGVYIVNGQKIYVK